MERPSAQNGIRNRLPTLDEVLLRKTRPPVDLFCFYIFLQREGNEDALDFWLDVHQHENLCRAYFKDLRKTGRTLKEEWPAYHSLAMERGSSYDAVTGLSTTSGSGNSRRSQALQAQAQLRNDGGESGSTPLSPPLLASGWRSPSSFAGDNSSGTGTGYYNEKPPLSPRETEAGSRFQQQQTVESPTTPRGPLLPEEQGQQQQSGGMSGDRRLSDPNSSRHHASSPSIRQASTAWGTGAISGSGVGGPASKTSRRKSKAPTVIPRSSAITRGELLLSAERIYARYLLHGGEKEIYLPPSLRIPSFPLPSQLSAHPSQTLEDDASAIASVPDMFVDQKAYIHTALVRDAFPRFLRAKAFGNLTPATTFLRLLLGLVLLWAGLVAGFCFIFLDIKPMRLRLTLLVPFYFSTHLLFSSLYALDPLLVLLFNRSETTMLRHLPLGEVYVRRLLRKRSIALQAVILVGTFAELAIFLWIPGHRL